MRRRGAAGDARGQALVEFALVVPILLILIIGIIEFGRAWNISQVLGHAAREGARSAALEDPAIGEDSVKSIVDNVLVAAGLEYPRDDILVDNMDVSGEPVRVSLAYEYRFVFFGPVIGWASDKSTITIRSSFAMRNE
jgi:hypothetical protein